ncbi:PKHD-type hydroxylase PiuC [Arenicella chitinivorans]|uniref:PKHD-type hydroxylase PiuC n=1 Tax=Arenicella chitinivorans TaxID=1329800 RepID=A0A918RIM4_9GAMM|nr:Fe2+-dependent dioxygenase [Arenicella chitinivorans]GHA00335.1 PKHD-type hydroxylase PiuC [Arenicella chitinivorans]
MLIVIEKVLTQDQVAEVRDALMNAPWHDGKASAGGLAVNRKSNQQLLDSSDTAKQLQQQLLTALGGNANFISAALPHKIYPPKFNCYQQGDTYGNHIDGAIMTLPHSGESLRTDISATLFLSDPEEYQGGELTVETTYGAQPVKLAAGDMVLYPATSLHRVNPITSGERVASFFWIQSLVRDTDQRSNLYDLDQSVQSLTSVLGPEHDDVVRLSGVYHNLVRRWSDC